MLNINYLLHFFYFVVWIIFPHFIHCVFVLKLNHEGFIRIKLFNMLNINYLNRSSISLYG